MTDNMFDKFVRDKLRDHQSSVPQGLWEKIEQRKDKDRKVGFLPKHLLWAGLVLLVTSLYVGYTILQDGDKTTTSSINETAAANDKSSYTSIDANGNGDLATTEDKQEDLNQNNDKTIALNAADDNLNTTTQTTSGNEKTYSEKDIVLKSSGHGIAVSRNRKSNYNSKPVNGFVAMKNDKNSSNTISINKKNSTGTQQDVPSNQFQPVYTLETSKKYIPFTQGKTAYNLRSLSAVSTDKQYDLSELKIVGIDCPPNGRMRRNDWYLELYGSPDITMKTVKADGNANFVSKKDSSETQQLSYTAGFRLSKSIGHNLLLKTGLQYSQINERFDLRTENERRITTVITIRTVITAGGVDSTVRDTTSLMQIGYRVQRTYNRYRSLDIPVLLSYEFGNENLKFALNAGAIINLRSWYSGNTLNDSLAVVSIDSKQNGLYKTNIGLGVYAGFSIIKPVSNKLDVFLEPYFKYNLSNMSRTAGISQRFNTAGISLGLRYRLNRQRSTNN